MMKFCDVLAVLDRNKGGSAWREIAASAGMHYDTVARVARGAMSMPSVQTIEKLSDAIEALGLDKVREQAPS